MTRNEIREAVARGWCASVNADKSIDVVLAESIVNELAKLIGLPDEDTVVMLNAPIDWAAAARLGREGIMTISTFDLIISHANCPDGAVAAWVALRHSPSAKLILASYDDPAPFEACRGKRVLVVDFCYEKPGSMLANVFVLARECHLTLLDHHKKSIDELHGRLIETQCTAILDKNRAGCRLAWDHLFPGEPPPPLVLYANARDLWAWDTLPFSREVAAAFQAVDTEGLGGDPIKIERHRALQRLDEFNDGLIDPGDFATVCYQGRAIQSYQATVIARAVAHARPGKIGDTPVMALNSTTLVSEIGEAIYKKHGGIACVWRGGEGGKIDHSLRSEKGGGHDCDLVARRFGGGGHAAAAGFQSDKLEVRFD